MKKSSEVFFSAFDELCDLKGRRDIIEGSGSLGKVLISSYPDTPVDGSTCTVTYGLSEVQHPEWIGGRPELFMCVNRPSLDWGHALGLSVLTWRREYLFEQGSVIHYGKPIVSSSGMDCFFLYTSDLIAPADQRVEMGGYAVNITQAYPIYQSEVSLLREVGSSAFFWDLGIDFGNVNRQPFVGLV